MMIRNEYRLPALRIGMSLSREDARVKVTPFLGHEQLDLPLHVTAEAIGIRRNLTPREYADPHFSLGPLEGELARFRKLLGKELGKRPLWLQIEPSAGHLAVVPWERLLQPVFHAPILRIPNFLVAPTFLEGRLVLAVCASSPMAKLPVPVADGVAAIVAEVRAAVPQGARVHVFADHTAAAALAALASDDRRYPVTVHPPDEAARFGVGSTESNLPDPEAQTGLRSPWLRWMQHTFGSERLDAVHFLCPGYFSGERGALALAQSPLAGAESDRRWSHFVGAAELMRFLDLTGAWAVALSVPRDDAWAVGLRLLAENLAWGRPAPVLVHDLVADRGKTLREAYRLLFAPTAQAAPRSPALTLYCHPQRVKALLEPGAEVETGLADARPARVLASLGLAGDASKHSREAAAAATPATEPAWKVAARLCLDQEVVRTAQRSDAERAGSEAALRLLGQMMGTGGDATAGAPDLASYLRSDRGRALARSVHSGPGGDEGPR